jgi:hypothetical protein
MCQPPGPDAKTWRKKPGETVLYYFAWNIETFKRLLASKTDDAPQDIATVVTEIRPLRTQP